MKKNAIHLLEKCRKYIELDAKFEKQKHNLESCQRRVKDLENEIATFGEWKEITKVS